MERYTSEHKINWKEVLNQFISKQSKNNCYQLLPTTACFDGKIKPILQQLELEVVIHPFNTTFCIDPKLKVIFFPSDYKKVGRICYNWNLLHEIGHYLDYLQGKLYNDYSSSNWRKVIYAEIKAWKNARNLFKEIYKKDINKSHKDIALRALLNHIGFQKHKLHYKIDYTNPLMNPCISFAPQVITEWKQFLSPEEEEKIIRKLSRSLKYE